MSRVALDFAHQCALVGLPTPVAEHRFAPPRRWRLLDVIKWRHGTTRKARNAVMRNVRPRFSAGSIGSALLLWTMRIKGVASKPSKGRDRRNLRNVRCGLHNSAAFSTVLLRSVPTRNGTTPSQGSPRRRAGKGMVQGPSESRPESLLEGRFGWVSSITSACVPSTGETVGVFALRDYRSGATLRLGQSIRTLSRHFRLCRDVPIVPSEVRP